MTYLMTIDVEDWFHSYNFNRVIAKEDWDYHTSRVCRNTEIILEILSENDVRGTFFVLGWVAERQPELIKKIHSQGHEIGCHGYYHDCVYDLSPDEFYRDIELSTKILEDLIGEKVLGYRAPNFSITDWAVDILMEHGYQYDSSYFPTLYHDRYGKFEVLPVQKLPVFKLKDNFVEVALSSLKIGPLMMPWAGGGYFRILPYQLFKLGVRRIQKTQGVYNFYIHPWEFDPLQPRINGLPRFNSFRQYNRLEYTSDHFSDLAGKFPFDSIGSILKRELGEF